MKNLFLLFAFITLISCGSTETESEVVLKDTTSFENVVVSDTSVFDSSGVSSVEELLDTLSAMPSEGGEVVTEESE